MAHVDLIGEDHETIQWTIPPGLVFQIHRIPGEETVAVGQEQPVDRQVASYGYQTIVLAIVRVWEPKLVILLIDCHLCM